MSIQARCIALIAMSVGAVVCETAIADAPKDGPQLQTLLTLYHPGYITDYGYITVTSLDRRPLKILSVAVNGQPGCTSSYGYTSLGRGDRLEIHFPRDAIDQSSDYGGHVRCPDQPAFVDISTSLGNMTYNFNP